MVGIMAKIFATRDANLRQLHSIIYQALCASCKRDAMKLTTHFAKLNLTSYSGLALIGQCDFKAIKPFRHDRFFKEALGITKVPSSVWIHQRFDAKGAELRELTGELTLRLTVPGSLRPLGCMGPVPLALGLMFQEE
jgi:hypothetical protein